MNSVCDVAKGAQLKIPRPIKMDVEEIECVLIDVPKNNRKIPSEMDVQSIECALIELPEDDRKLRTINEEFVRKLADSISLQGMYNPVAVRQKPDVPGRYLLVQGRHRFLANRDVLKEALIDCNVLDLDDEGAELATIAENLWHNPLTKSQLFICVKKWHGHYLKIHPDKVGRGKAGSIAAAKARRERNGLSCEEMVDSVATDRSGKVTLKSIQAVLKCEDLEDGWYSKIESRPARNGKATADEDGVLDATFADTEKLVKDDCLIAEPVHGFCQMLAEATGHSLSSAKRLQRIALAFTLDQLSVFDETKTPETDMTRIAKIGDLTLRGDVVELIEAGMEPQEAVKQVMKDKAPTRDNGKSKAERKAKAVADEEALSHLSDDEWFETVCAERAKSFTEPERFKRDALLYRAISEPRRIFCAKVKKVVEEALSQPGFQPPLFHLINRLISIGHPKDWLICSRCKGSGHDGRQECRGCFGSGYKLKSEECH